jgi:drug/metabolite transporter (DMT)-like permease
MNPTSSAPSTQSSSSVAASGWFPTQGLLLTNGVLIALLYALAKVAAAGGVSALGLLSWQVLFAAIAIGIVAAIRGRLPALTLANVRYAGVAGVLGTAPNLLTFSALSHLPAGLVGVVAALSPIFTYAIALALKVETMRPLRAVGIGLGLIGVLAIMLPRGALPDTGALPWALAAIAAPLLHASGNLFRSLAWPDGLKPLSAASLLLVLQAMVLVPVAIALGEFELPSVSFEASDLALLATGALTASLYLGSFKLQRRVGPVGVAQLGYVVTVASLVIGAIAFGEHYPLITLPAVAVVLLGVTLVNRRPAAARRSPGSDR